MNNNITQTRHSRLIKNNMCKYILLLNYYHMDFNKCIRIHVRL